MGTLDPSAIKSVQNLPNVKDSVILKGGFVETDVSPQTHIVSADKDKIAKVAPSIAKEMKPGVALMTSMGNSPKTMDFSSSKGKVSLDVKEVNGLPYNDILVTERDMNKIVPSVGDQAAWVHLKDRSNLASVLTVMISPSTNIDSQHMDVGGGALIGLSLIHI